MAINSLVKFYPGEEWKELALEDKLKLKYAISTLGRVISYSDSMESGRLVKSQKIDGYSVFRYKARRNGKIFNKTLFVRKLVAQNFLTPPSPEHTFVILLDRNRGNNKVENLKWATREEMIDHYKKSPYFIGARIKKRNRGIGHKLTSTKVLFIKKKLFDPNRKTRMKILAKQFGISEMQLYRIKTGENWGHVKI